MSVTKKIILAEDNPADVELIKMAFKEIALPFELVHVFDGQDLLNYLQKSNLEDIALILLDLNMPRLGGVEVLQKFYSHDSFKKLPVVVFSSSTHESDIKTCYDFGANAYVRKPIDINDFTKTLRSIAQFWGQVNVLPSFT